jgi:hypothetical protein
MNRLLLLIIASSTFALAIPKNTFIIKNSSGKVIKGKRIQHLKNVYYDEFLKEQQEILAQLTKLEKKRKKLYQKNTLYDKDSLLKNAKKYLGGKYVWGGTEPDGFDCSGYVRYVYNKEGIHLPRTAYEQSQVGQPIHKLKELTQGDLLFFLTDKSRGIPVTHVGIYMGKDKFIHAASRRKGIIISSLSKSKYGKLLVKVTRVIQ